MKLAEGRQKTRSKVLVVNSSDVDNIRLKRGIPPGFRLREAVSSNAPLVSRHIDGPRDDRI